MSGASSSSDAATADDAFIEAVVTGGRVEGGAAFDSRSRSYAGALA
jgi:hypothetical protein